MSQEVPPTEVPPQHDLPRDIEEPSWGQKIKEKCLPGIRITLLLSLIFYIAMFGVGIWGIKKCPIEDNIPFFLIVIGGIGVLSKFASVVREAILGQYPVQYVESSLYTVELVFMFLGSFWVFKEYKPNYTPGPNGQDYCDKTVYTFAFVYLAVIYSILGILLISYLCFIGCFFFVVRTERRDIDPEAPSRPLRTEQ